MKDLNKKFYITTTLPYVNADPHIGFASEIVRADIVARYRRLLGEDVFFNTGTDEHGLKIYRKAKEEGGDTQAYVDKYSKRFDELKDKLNLSYTSFIRTTNEHHIKSAQEFWKRCQENGDIYKKNYKVKYCVGCELEKTDSELDENNRCSFHPNQEVELIEEENYFFRWSNYGDKLLKFYEENPDFVVPDFRFNEIKRFIERGLKDFSISRLKAKMPWGVPVPNDDEHVMYVWFDALVNYISALGWPENKEKFEQYWGTKENRNAIQVAGKDNLRQQSAMWQAMLMSAGLPLSKQIFIFGFVNSGGQKMSKSLGNVVNPFDLVEEYGTDAVRYYIARHFNTFEDSDFTMEKFKELYNANLANGLGNLVSRILAMTQGSDVDIYTAESNKEKLFEQFKKGKFFGIRNIETGGGGEKFIEKKMPNYLFYSNEHSFIFGNMLESFDFQNAMMAIMADVKSMNVFIASTGVYRKESKNRDENLMRLLINLKNIALSLQPFMPETAEKIKNLIKENKSPETPLFLRK